LLRYLQASRGLAKAAAAGAEPDAPNLDTALL
jgi:hypothetical protein